MTFALRMTKIEHMDKLEKVRIYIQCMFWFQVCADCGPLELKVKEFFLSSVDRIRPVVFDFMSYESRRDAEVYCIGRRSWGPNLKRSSFIDYVISCHFQAFSNVLIYPFHKFS